MKNKLDYRNVFIGIFIVIIIVTVWFMISASKPSSTSYSAQSGQMNITLVTTPNPPHVGSNDFIIQVNDAQGKPLDNADVSFDVSMTTMNMGSQRGTATAKGNGQYAASGMFSMGGPWRVSTTVKTPAGETATKDSVVNVQ